MADAQRREVNQRWRELPRATRKQAFKLARKGHPYPDAGVRGLAAAYANGQLARPVWQFALMLVGAVSGVSLGLRLIYGSFDEAMPAIIGAIVGGVVGGLISVSTHRKVRDVNSAALLAAPIDEGRS